MSLVHLGITVSKIFSWFCLFKNISEGFAAQTSSLLSKAIAWPRMKNAGFWEKVVGQLADPSPRHAIRLAAPPERAPP